MSDPVIRAVEHSGSSRTLVDTAEDVAALVLAQMETGRMAFVSLEGLRGVASSFFNVILDGVVARWGLAGLDRLEFRCETPTQASVLERSLKSVRSGAA